MSITAKEVTYLAVIEVVCGLKCAITVTQEHTHRTARPISEYQIGFAVAVDIRC